MKNFTIYLAVFLCALLSKIYAQGSFETQAKAIAYSIEKITKEEKKILKNEVEAVNNQLDLGKITKQQADEKKLALANQSAANIETRVAAEEAKLTQLVKDKVEGKIKYDDGKIAIEEKDTSRTNRIFSISYSKNDKKRDSIRQNRSERRTTTQFVFAAGLNNVLTDGKVSGSDFKYWGSHFYEWGLTWNTRLSKTSNIAHVKYGFSVMYNNLRATDNRVFVTAPDSKTLLTTTGINYDDSRLKNVHLVFPLHFELDFSKTKIKNDKPLFRSHEGFRVGLGGYAGFNVHTKQYLEFSESGNDVEVVSEGPYNVNNFIYGLSSYIGYKETSLYIKYDLNPVFSNNTIKQNNISLGVRFDLN
jgi:hypothetical protein